MSEVSTLESEVAKLIVEILNLDEAPEEINPTEPLFGEGLGLDSIDALELAVAVSQNYGFKLRSDDPDNKDIYSSLRSLSAHIEANRKN